MSAQGIRPDGLRQPIVKFIGDGAKARVAIATHVVKTHAAANDQHPLLPQRRQRAAKLRAAHVIVNHEERQDLIREQAAAVAHAEGLLLVADEGLVAAAQVDDGQAAVAHRHTARGHVMNAFVVRPAVHQRLRHGVQGVIAQRLLAPVPVAQDAAHVQFAPWPPRRRTVHQQIFRSSHSEASRA